MHLGLRALRWAGAFAKPQLVANSVLAGMLTRETCHTESWRRVDQHVDDLAQCAVGRQTAVIKQMVEAAERITLACDRLSLVIDTGGGSRRAVGVMRKRCRRLAVIRRHTKKVTSLYSTNVWPCASCGAALRHPPCKASHRTLRTPCALSLVDVSRQVLPLAIGPRVRG